MDNWIKGFLEYVKDTESPKIFNEWTAYSIIAASLERRLFITRGHVTIYPDLYVILVGKSGIRKSAAAKIGINDIMRPLGQFNIISVLKASAESIYKELSDKGKLDHCIYLFSDELQTFLGSSGFKNDVIGALTALYDSPEIGEHRTLSSGTKIITNANVNMLACTTFNYVGVMLPKEAIECGFAGRVMWITAQKPGRKHAWGSPEVDYSLRDLLREDLQRMKNLMGRVTVSREAYFFYENWYNKHSPNYDSVMEPYLLRKGTTVLKLAMILAVSSTSVSKIEEFIILISHIDEATKILSRAEKTMTSVYNSSMGDIAKNCERITEKMKQLGGADISHSKMAKSLYRYIRTGSEFKEAIEYLVDLKRIKRGRTEKGGQVYSLSDTGEIKNGS